jgi:hypothetical protein
MILAMWRGALFLHFAGCESFRMEAVADASRDAIARSLAAPLSSNAAALSDAGSSSSARPVNVDHAAPAAEGLLHAG